MRLRFITAALALTACGPRTGYGIAELDAQRLSDDRVQTKFWVRPQALGTRSDEVATELCARVEWLDPSMVDGGVPITSRTECKGGSSVSFDLTSDVAIPVDAGVLLRITPSESELSLRTAPDTRGALNWSPTLVTSP